MLHLIGGMGRHRFRKNRESWRRLKGRQMATILVTGAGGFIGRALVPELAARGDRVVAVQRSGGRPAPPGTADALTLPADRPPDWERLLEGAHKLVHLAAKVHAPGRPAPERTAGFRTGNLDLSAALAEAAARVGLERFVHLSTFALVPLLGRLEAGEIDEAAAWRLHPYEMSKIAAERALREISLRTGLPLVVLRPPLVYGPGAVANMERLVRVVQRGVPLPFGAVRNRRSLIHVGNLASAVLAALDHPAAPGEVFEVSDGEDLSTPELIRRIAAALSQREPPMVPVPPGLLALLLRLAGRRDWVPRLLGDAWLDPTPIRQALGWVPPVSVAEGLATLAQAEQSAPTTEGQGGTGDS
ncbi:MAG: NAD-dependent epimerase/dehydratase family protein [Rhodospirillaceae bacterium]|nr:NAD-dependent epimerase/dehydratase family protein [Rhodospirillaceae bacterium]